MSDNAAYVAVLGMICLLAALGTITDGCRAEAAQTNRPAAHAGPAASPPPRPAPRLARALAPARAAAIASNAPGRVYIPSPSLRPAGWPEPRGSTPPGGAAPSVAAPLGATNAAMKGTPR